MPIRSFPLATGEYYHLFNRGAAKQPTFLNAWDYRHALVGMDYYRFTKPPIRLSQYLELKNTERAVLLDRLQEQDDQLVEIICYVLMPNHFHIVAKQLVENGISTFLRRWTNSYCRYFNTRHDRVGSLYQGVFKSVHVSSTEQLLHLSRYIHLNPLVSFIVRDEDLLNFPWSSLADYLKGSSAICNIEPVMSHFRESDDYRTFVLDRADYAKQLEEIKHQILE